MSALKEREMEEGREREREDGELKELYHPRRNGWNCPWHPLQVLAWAFIFFFSTTYFGFLVLYIPGAWRSIGYILGIGLFLLHIVASLVTSVMDPAEAAVRRRKPGRASGGFLRAVFDREKHAHVIEDHFCNLCNVNVTSGAKHCSVCDKCVVGFDHHCIWLNTCIGSRNYRWFMVTVFSGLVACILLFLFTLALFVTFFSARDKLRYNCGLHFLSGNTSSCSAKIGLFGARVPDPVFPVVVAFVGLLASVGVIMIGYLATFHVYLNVKGLTTYDYIMLQREREREEEEEAARDTETEDTGHGRCWFLRRKVNRVAPSAVGDAEKGQETSSGLAGGMVSNSPSLNSVGLFNFGRTPAQSILGSSVGDVSVSSTSTTASGAAAAQAAAHWKYGVRGSQEQLSQHQHEVVIEMEAQSSNPAEVSSTEALVERKAAKYVYGTGESAVRDDKNKEKDREFDQGIENCGTLAFMSSSNSICSVERGGHASLAERDGRAAAEPDEDLENCGTLAFMSSVNSVVSTGSGSVVPTGVQITLESCSGECSAVVCGNASLVNPKTLGSATAMTNTQRDAPVCATTEITGERKFASVRGGIKPLASTETDEMRERKYEAMILSGNTVGLRALKQLASFKHQSPASKEDVATSSAGFSNPLCGQRRWGQGELSRRHEVWEYIPPPPTRRSLPARLPAIIPQGAGSRDDHNDKSLTSLTSSASLV